MMELFTRSPMENLRTLLRNTIYAIPPAPPKTRPADKPMQVLCVGLPRSETESLQQALLKLGYIHTNHGWDLMADGPTMVAWTNLCDKKWHSSTTGEADITREDFDALLGDCVAVTDAAGSCFAREIIAAYPEAKVILNQRRDIDAWYASLCASTVAGEQLWSLNTLGWFDAEAFWSWEVYCRGLWSRMFRSPTTNYAGPGMVPMGKTIYKEHVAMVRGLGLPRVRLLEWYVEDGWEPLCAFLGKEVPKEDFPTANAGGHFYTRLNGILETRMRRAMRNLVLLSVGGVGAIAYAVMRMKGLRIDWGAVQRLKWTGLTR